MITNKEEYLNCKDQLHRQIAEAYEMQKRLDTMNSIIDQLQSDIDKESSTYEVEEVQE